MLGLQETTSAGTPTARTYSCVACSSTFQTLASLLVHQASHANDISHQPLTVLPSCGNCGSLFASADLLERHHCMVVPPPAFQELYICECGEELDDLSCLDEHRKSHKPDPEVTLDLDSYSEPQCLEMELESKADSSHPSSCHVSANLPPSPLNEKPVVQNSSSDSEINEIVPSTKGSLSLNNKTLNKEKNVNPKEFSLSQPVIEEQVPVFKKDCNALESSSMLDHSAEGGQKPAKDSEKSAEDIEKSAEDGKKYEEDYEKSAEDAKKYAEDCEESAEDCEESAEDGEKSAEDCEESVEDGEKSVEDCEKSDSCNETNGFNKKSILKMLASAYMTHRQPTEMKPEQTKRSLPPRKVSPRAPVQAATTITMSKSELLENQSKAKSPEKVPCSTSTSVNIKHGKMLARKGKIISVIQTLYPVVSLETRQKLFGKDNIEGRLKCGVCCRVFKDKDSLIMHHAQHKRERVKFCLSCKQFVVCAPENHICFSVNRQRPAVVNNVSMTAPVKVQCTVCKRSYSCKRNLKRHNCPGRPTLTCSSDVVKQNQMKLSVLKNYCNRSVQNSKINQPSTHHVGVGTELIKTEEQITEFSIERKNLNMQSSKPRDQLHSAQSLKSFNSTPTVLTGTAKKALQANTAEKEAEEKDQFGEKQWTMPLDDAEIDDNQENEDSSSENEGHDADEDVVLVEPRNKKKIDSELQSNDFQVHVSDEGVKRFVCAGCKRSYSRRSKLMQHLKICGASKIKQQIPAPIKRFPCPQCGRFFSRKDNLKKHRQVCKAVQPNLPVAPRIVESKPQAAQDNLFVLSPTTETPTVRPESNRSSSSNWGIMSLPSVLPRKVTCECGASFTCPRLLFEHLQHHAQESYICPHCGENLQSWMDFEAHQKIHRQSQASDPPRTHSFNQVAQSHVPPQQPLAFSQVLQSQGPTATSTSFQQPPALLPPQNVNHVPQPQILTCQKCKKTFAGRRSLLRHQRLSCRGDAEGQVKQSVHNPSNTSNPAFKPLRCPVCVRWFSCLDGLKRHLVSHSRQPVNMFPCQICSHNCTSIQALEEHKRNAHKVNQNQIVQTADKREQISSTRTQSLLPTEFQCHICHRYYPKLQSLKDHVRKVHRLKPSSVMKPPNLIKPPNVPKPSHLSIVDQIRSGPFQCQICMRAYPTIKSLKNHRRRVHHIVGGVFQAAKGTDPVFATGPVQCQICSYSFPDINSLQIHKKRAHRLFGGLDQGVNPQGQHNLFKCQICPRSYPDLESLKNHRSVHQLLGPVSQTTTTIAEMKTNDSVEDVDQKPPESLLQIKPYL